MKPMSITIGCIMCALLVAVLYSGLKPNTSVATFNLQRVQGQFIQQLALHKASNDVVNTSSRAFKRQLQTVLGAYARENRLVILDSEQVLASPKDITESIVERLSAAMRERS